MALLALLTTGRTVSASPTGESPGFAGKAALSAGKAPKEAPGNTLPMSLTISLLGHGSDAAAESRKG